MSKRRADKQMTKDDFDREDDNQVPTQAGGIQIASQEVQRGRKILSARRRVNPSSNPMGAAKPSLFGNLSSTASNATGGFSGISFGAPSKPAEISATKTETNSTFGGFNFGAPKKDSGSSFSGFNFGAPKTDTQTDTSTSVSSTVFKFASQTAPEPPKSSNETMNNHKDQSKPVNSSFKMDFTTGKTSQSNHIQTPKSVPFNNVTKHNQKIDTTSLKDLDFYSDLQKLNTDFLETINNAYFSDFSLPAIEYFIYIRKLLTQKELGKKIDCDPQKIAPNIVKIINKEIDKNFGLISEETTEKVQEIQKSPVKDNPPTIPVSQKPSETSTLFTAAAKPVSNSTFSTPASILKESTEKPAPKEPAFSFQAKSNENPLLKADSTIKPAEKSIVPPMATKTSASVFSGFKFSSNSTIPPKRDDSETKTPVKSSASLGSDALSTLATPPDNNTFGSGTGAALGTASTPKSSATSGNILTSGAGSIFGAGSTSIFGTGSTTKFGATTTSTFGTGTTSTFGTGTTPSFGSGTTSTSGAGSTLFGNGTTSSSGTGTTTVFGSGTTSFGNGTTSSFGTGSTSIFGTGTATTFGTGAVSTFGTGSTATFGTGSTGFGFGSSTQPPVSNSNFKIPTFKSIENVPNENKDQAQGDSEENEAPPKVEAVEHEEEDSVYTRKVKLYLKQDDKFLDKGVGFLYIKKKDEQKPQLLVRSATATGNILLNIHLSTSLPVQVVEKGVMITCIPNPPIGGKDEKEMATFLLRVKTSKDAEEVHQKFIEHRSN